MGAEWGKTAKSGRRARTPRKIPREIALEIPRLLAPPVNFPGNWILNPISREIPRAISKFPGNPTGNTPRFGISRRITREVGRGIRLPGKFPGKSVAPDGGRAPWELIAIKSGISARRRRSGGHQPQVVTRLDASPASPRVGAGVSGPRERMGAPCIGIPRITPVAFSGSRTPRFLKPRPIGTWRRPYLRALIKAILLTRFQRSHRPGDRAPKKGGDRPPLIRDQCPERGHRKLAMGDPRCYNR